MSKNKNEGHTIPVSETTCMIECEKVSNNKDIDYDVLAEELSHCPNNNIKEEKKTLKEKLRTSVVNSCIKKIVPHVCWEQKQITNGNHQQSETFLFQRRYINAFASKKICNKTWSMSHYANDPAWCICTFCEREQQDLHRFHKVHHTQTEKCTSFKNDKLEFLCVHHMSKYELQIEGFE